MRKITLISLLFGLAFISCKKNIASRSSSDKEIYSFVLPMPSPVPWAGGLISNDTITVRIQPGIVPENIVPYIEFTGASINPAIGDSVNFTHPVVYTVIADDGSTRDYIVLVTSYATTKQILDFRFRPTENAGLTSEVIGEFPNDSTIIVRMPGSADIHSLVPTIAHNGVSIGPSSGVATDFGGIVNYTVTAEDGSTKKYNVLVTSNSKVFIGSANGNVYALDAVNGQQLWNFNGGHPMGSPIYYQGKIYVAAQGGLFYCLNAGDGSVLWSFNGHATSYTSACVYNGKVFVGYNNVGPYGDGLYALDASTGNLLWSKILANGVGYGGIATPTAVDGYVVITESNTGVQVFNVLNGNSLWVHYPGIIMANPLVAGGIIYVGSEGTLLTAYDLLTGNILWFNSTVSNPFGSPVMVNDVIYVRGGLRMYALNKSNGAVIWAEQSWGGYLGIGDGSHSSVGRFSSAAISLADTTLYAGCDDYGTYCLNLTTGSKKWVYPNSVEIKETAPNPVVAHGMVVVNREDNSLYAFSSRNGMLLWKFTASDAINTDPCMIDNSGNVFYTGNSGQ